MPTFMRLPALAKRLGLSVRTIHDRVRSDPDFPQPVRLGTAPQSPLGFVVTEVEAYEMLLMAARKISTPSKEVLESIDASEERSSELKEADSFAKNLSHCILRDKTEH